MQTGTEIEFETRGPVALITLNRPGRRNAVDAATTRALRAALERLEADDELAVGILRGHGPVFSAGMDLRAFVDGEADEILFGPGRFGGFVSHARKKPLIAAVHGAALAGGFELMLACDLVVAAEGCRFGLPEAGLGLVAGAGGAFRVAARLPRAIANEIVLGGALFDTERALQFGLVNRVVPEEELLEAALVLAERLAANAPLSLQAGRALVEAGSAGGREEDLWRLNDEWLRRCIASEDAREGAIAFAEKRPPVWRGK
jgi:enoyl-CoA hydratase